MAKGWMVLSLVVLSVAAGCNKGQTGGAGSSGGKAKAPKKVWIKVQSQKGNCEVDKKSIDLYLNQQDTLVWCVHNKVVSYQIHFTDQNPFDTSGANNPINATKNDNGNGDNCSDEQTPTNSKGDYYYEIDYTDNYGNSKVCTDPHVILK